MRLKNLIALMCCSAMAGAGATLLWRAEAPTPATHHVDTLVLVGQIQELARLHSATMPVTTTIRGERGSGWLKAAAGEEMLFVAHGDAVAGVDLREVTASDIEVVDGVVHVDLPPARIWSVALDEQRSGVQYRKVGWVGRADTHFETRARREAIARLRHAAEQTDLLDRAEDAAQRAVVALLQDARVAVAEGEGRPAT